VDLAPRSGAPCVGERAWCGQSDARWIGLYDVLDLVFAIPEACVMRGAVMLARSCGWWWAFRDAAYLCERQARDVRDDCDRLHGTDGPAVSFRDRRAALRDRWASMP